MNPFDEVFDVWPLKLIESGIRKVIFDDFEMGREFLPSRGADSIEQEVAMELTDQSLVYLVDVRRAFDALKRSSDTGVEIYCGHRN